MFKFMRFRKYIWTINNYTFLNKCKQLYNHWETNGTCIENSIVCTLVQMFFSSFVNKTSHGLVWNLPSREESQLASLWFHHEWFAVSECRNPVVKWFRQVVPSGHQIDTCSKKSTKFDQKLCRPSRGTGSFEHDDHQEMFFDGYLRVSILPSTRVASLKCSSSPSRDLYLTSPVSDKFPQGCPQVSPPHPFKFSSIFRFSLPYRSYRSSSLLSYFLQTHHFDSSSGIIVIHIVHAILCRYQQSRISSLGVVCVIRVYFNSCLLFRVCFFTDPRVSSLYIFLYVSFA
jgi:hypothetical protein